MIAFQGRLFPERWPREIKTLSTKVRKFLLKPFSYTPVVRERRHKRRLKTTRLSILPCVLNSHRGL